MNWHDRANVIRRLYAERDAWWLARSRRAEAGQEVEGMLEDGIRILLVDRGVAWIAAYHEAGETDEAFEALRRRADAVARLGQHREAIDDLILVPVRAKIELMYDEMTAERLMVAFERGCRPTERPRFRRR
jgi:hypothetical protein